MTCRVFLKLENYEYVFTNFFFFFYGSLQQLCVSFLQIYLQVTQKSYFMGTLVSVALGMFQNIFAFKISLRIPQKAHIGNEIPEFLLAGHKNCRGIKCQCTCPSARLGKHLGLGTGQHPGWKSRIHLPPFELILGKAKLQPLLQVLRSIRGFKSCLEEARASPMAKASSMSPLPPQSTGRREMWVTAEHHSRGRQGRT